MTKILQVVGGLAFALGLFVVVFCGVPWHVIVADDPAIPTWLRVSIFGLLGGILLVLLTAAIEQWFTKKPSEASCETEDSANVMVLNTDYVPGREVTESLGVVQGHTVYAIWLGNDLPALMRLILGGEVTEYTDMMGKARQVAVERMRGAAAALGADAVVNVRYMTTSVVGTASELLAYGTAVRLG